MYRSLLLTVRIPMRELWIGMQVWDGEDEDRLLKAESVNFLDPRARQMIARTAWWAMHEGHEMVTWRLEDGETVEHYDSREER
jgi:hypothetical protein